MALLAGALGALAFGLVIKLLLELYGLALETGHEDRAQGALAALLVLLVAFAPWFEFLWRTPEGPSSWRIRFSLRTLLWTFTIFAAYLAGLAPQQTRLRQAQREASHWQERARWNEQHARQLVNAVEREMGAALYKEQLAKQALEAKLDEILAPPR